MSSRLQLDVRNLSLGRRHLLNAYEVKAGIGNIVRSMPERAPCVYYKTERYINTLTFTFFFLVTKLVFTFRGAVVNYFGLGLC